jgi:hypothetical protein
MTNTDQKIEAMALEHNPWCYPSIDHDNWNIAFKAGAQAGIKLERERTDAANTKCEELKSELFKWQDACLKNSEKREAALALVDKAVELIETCRYALMHYGAINTLTKDKIENIALRASNRFLEEIAQFKKETES